MTAALMGQSRNRLGRTSIEVEPFCFGTMNLGSATPDDESARMIRYALAEGVRFFNLSDFEYEGRSETILGRVLSSLGERDEVTLCVEISGPDMGVPHDPDLSPEYIFRACEAALRRLRTDYIDIYTIPRPSNRIPIAETLGALTELVQAGKVRAVATSTYPAWRVMEALAVADRESLERVDVDASPYNLLDRRLENEFVPFALAHDVSVLAWAPLAQGMLAGRYVSPAGYPVDSRAARIGRIYQERITPHGIRLGTRFAELAAEVGMTPAQLALTWVRAQPAVAAPVVGPRTQAQLEELLAARELTYPDSLDGELDALNPPGTAAVDFYNSAPWMQMAVEPRQAPI